MNETANRRLETLVMHMHEVQNKYVYYILAVDAACTGFTINYTKDLVLTAHEILLASSLCAWGISFYFGIAQIQNHEVGIQMNIRQLAAHLEQKAASPNLQERQLASQSKAIVYRKLQNWLLFVGVILFVVWRISL